MSVSIDCLIIEAERFAERLDRSAQNVEVRVRSYVSVTGLRHYSAALAWEGEKGGTTSEGEGLSTESALRGLISYLEVLAEKEAA